MTTRIPKKVGGSVAIAALALGGAVPALAASNAKHAKRHAVRHVGAAGATVCDGRDGRARHGLER